MKIAYSIFILLVSYFTFSQKTVNETQLTKSESKLFLEQELYSGMVFNQFPNNQVKSIYQVDQGLVKGKMIEYRYDSLFKSLNYQDTAELNKLNFQLTTKSNELESKIKDSINTNKLTMDYLNYDIGGNEKWIALQIKNKEGKLKSKKKEIFDKYEQLVQSKNSANHILSEIRKAIHEVNQKINKETQKPSFIGKKSKEFEQVNFIEEGNTIIYDSLGNKFGEGNFIKGLPNGAWVYYYNNGAKMAAFNYLVPHLEGWFFDGTGFPMYGIEGLFNSFYENGNKKEVSIYKEGKLDGLCTAYNEIGLKTYEINYSDDLSNGKTTVYNNGVKTKEVQFIKGNIHGPVFNYFENGKIESKFMIDSTYLYHAGIKGDFYEYNENGSLKTHRFFNKDGSEAIPK